MTTVSVYTACNNKRWIADAERSLLAQTVQPDQWVVMYNGDAQPDRAGPSFIDERASTSTGIGAIKADAVEACTGDVIVELDQDDMLMPTCIEQVLQALDDDAFPLTFSLAYSDWTHCDAGGAPVPNRWDAMYGWLYYHATVNGQAWDVTRALPPTPQHLSRIWYAPNHVRAFPRWAYDACGGYNRGLDICDDHDLICRLYMVGEFIHLPEPLYVQRLHDEQTQVQSEVNKRIQTETVRIGDAWLPLLVGAWERRYAHG